MIQIGELHRITDKEYGSVVSYQIPIAFFSIEFDGKAADITLGIGSTTLTGHCGKAYEHICLFTDFREKFSTRIAGYIVRSCKSSESTATLGMHTSFRNNLAIEMGQFLHQPGILHHDRTAGTCGLSITVIRHGSTDFCC